MDITLKRITGVGPICDVGRWLHVSCYFYSGCLWLWNICMWMGLARVSSPSKRKKRLCLFGSLWLQTRSQLTLAELKTKATKGNCEHVYLGGLRAWRVHCWQLWTSIRIKNLIQPRHLLSQELCVFTSSFFHKTGAFSMTRKDECLMCRCFSNLEETVSLSQISPKEDPSEAAAIGKWSKDWLGLFIFEELQWECSNFVIFKKDDLYRELPER